MALLKEPRFFHHNHFRVTLSSFLSVSKSQQLSLSRNKNTDSNSKSLLSLLLYLENQSDRRCRLFS